MANTTQSGSPQANLVGNGGGESLRDRFSKITQDMDWIKASLQELKDVDSTLLDIFQQLQSDVDELNEICAEHGRNRLSYCANSRYSNRYSSSSFGEMELLSPGGYRNSMEVVHPELTPASGHFHLHSDRQTDAFMKRQLSTVTESSTLRGESDGGVIPIRLTNDGTGGSFLSPRQPGGGGGGGAPRITGSPTYPKLSNGGAKEEVVEDTMGSRNSSVDSGIQFSSDPENQANGTGESSFTGSEGRNKKSSPLGIKNDSSSATQKLKVPRKKAPLSTSVSQPTHLASTAGHTHLPPPPPPTHEKLGMRVSAGGAYITPSSSSPPSSSSSSISPPTVSQQPTTSQAHTRARMQDKFNKSNSNKTCVLDTSNRFDECSDNDQLLGSGLGGLGGGSGDSSLLTHGNPAPSSTTESSSDDFSFAADVFSAIASLRGAS